MPRGVLTSGHSVTGQPRRARALTRVLTAARERRRLRGELSCANAHRRPARSWTLELLHNACVCATSTSGGRGVSDFASDRDAPPLLFY